MYNSRKSIRNLLISLFIIGIIALLGSCAGLRERPEPPKISLAGLEIQEIGLFEQRYLVKLRLQNPNAFALDINGMNYEIFINDRPFAHGVSRNAVSLPSFGEDVLQVDVISNLNRIFEQLRNLEQGFDRPFSYRITGGMKLNNWPVKIPFQLDGELAPLPMGKFRSQGVQYPLPEPVLTSAVNIGG
jgi:LEA14-like dessication related protein